MTIIPPAKRYRLYFDETGTGDIKAHEKDPNQRYLSVTGIVFRQDIHDITFSSTLSAFKLRIFDTPNVILHRRDIMGHKGIFEALKDEALRAEFDRQFAALVASLPGPAFTVSIDKKAHLEKYKIWRFDPYHYVLTCLVERYVLWLKRSGCVGDVMGEARSPWHDGRLRRAYRRLYDLGSDFLTAADAKARLISRELRLEPKSTDVAALQVADLLAHPAHRTWKFMQENKPIPNDYGASLVRILEKGIYDRHPRTNLIKGCGRKWLP
ncbi:DUF3800 domain-containing protein [Bradyrhizobium liaoningense]|uniref:DUF3800 domain-containing protein n=1 Tax=Bradyrhizobium liaoningense TaxID=43992 RepID=UPI001BA4EE59|nr:DUF3800 domain-containing protein [Bradyrhizobium liaoningense]MBR0982443.1 DUF3800 domain-containing protein [Bradyrhizobium liaoningense]